LKLLALWKAEAKLIIRRLPIVFSGLLVICFSVIVSLPPSLLSGMTARDISVALVCGADPLLTKTISGMAADYDLIKRIYIVDDIETAEAGLERGKYDVLLDIPDNVAESLMFGEKISVRVKASDPLIGTIAYQLADSTVDTINDVATVVNNEYANISRDANHDGFYRFVNHVLTDAIVRFSYIDDLKTSKPYDTQAVSLVLFIVVAVASVFIAVQSAGQIADGYLKRLRVRGFPIWKLIAVKLANAVIISLVLSAAVPAALYMIKIKCNPVRFFISVGVLSLIVTGICLSVLTIRERRSVSVTRSMLGCTAVLLMLLFWGGGFYPIYLMSMSVRKMNPAWLSHLLADWSLTGNFPHAGTFALFLLPFAICVFIAARRFGRSLC
jgi:hypothetical protein